MRPQTETVTFFVVDILTHFIYSSPFSKHISVIKQNYCVFWAFKEAQVSPAAQTEHHDSLPETFLPNIEHFHAKKKTVVPLLSAAQLVKHTFSVPMSCNTANVQTDISFN